MLHRNAQLAFAAVCSPHSNDVHAGQQADGEDLRSRNAALEVRAEEAEGALAAAQAEVEVVTHERQRSVAALTAQAERQKNDMLASHTAEARASRQTACR